MKYDPSMLNIGRTKQLLVDDLVIECAENICRTWHRPVKVTEAPLIKRDRPWENIPVFHCNTWQVIRDPQDNLFKCWYGDLKLPDLLKSGELVFGQSVWSTLYAESEDGINWHKPPLNIHPINGHDTNIVLPHAYDLGMLLDRREQDSNKRFKMICTQHLPGQDSGEIIAATSADGIHWNVLEQRPSIGRRGAHLDDVIILDYDPHGGVYILSTRHYDMYAVARNLKNPVTNTFCPPYYPLDWRRMNKRRVWQAESSDCLHWSELYSVLTPDDNDNLDEAFGGMCRYAVGGVTMGLVESMRLVPNTCHVRLAYSRDGKTFEHLNNRQAFLEPGGDETWDAYVVTVPSKPIEVNDELWIYYGGGDCHHDWWITGDREGLNVPEANDKSLARMGLGLAKLRLDGFASLEAGYARPGIVITRPLISDGSKLVVNARCKTEGSISAEIVDVNDDVIPGFSKADCDVLSGDSVRHTFSWRGQTKIPVFSTERAIYPEPERERFRKIRFFMQNAEIYSFALE